jgi:hypothetical protein
MNEALDCLGLREDPLPIDFVQFVEYSYDFRQFIWFVRGLMSISKFTIVRWSLTGNCLTAVGAPTEYHVIVSRLLARQQTWEYIMWLPHLARHIYYTISRSELVTHS